MGPVSKENPDRAIWTHFKLDSIKFIIFKTKILAWTRSGSWTRSRPWLILDQVQQGGWGREDGRGSKGGRGRRVGTRVRSEPYMRIHRRVSMRNYKYLMAHSHLDVLDIQLLLSTKSGKLRLRNPSRPDWNHLKHICIFWFQHLDSGKGGGEYW